MNIINDPSSNVNSLLLVENQKSGSHPSAGRVTPGPVRCDTAQNVMGATHISCPPQLANSSIDTVAITCNCLFSSRIKILNELKKLKTFVQSTTDDEIPYTPTLSGLFSFNLQRTGIKYYPYVLRCGDIILALADRPLDSSIPNLTISIGSLSCNQDLSQTIKTLKMWLSHLGISIVTEKVSRIDLCADVKESISNAGVHDQDFCVCRATSYAQYRSHKKLTGVQIGKGSIVLRAYDKQKEMVEKRDMEKIFFFNDLWKTTPQEPITRVEFQLRREAIKEFMGEGSDTTFEAVKFQLKAIWKYLVKDWARFTDSPIDRDNNHQNRAEMSNFWKSLQDAFGSIVSAVRNKKQRHINIPDLRRQASGIMMSIAAGLGHCHTDFFGILATIQNIMREDLVEYMGGVNFDKRFALKINNAFVSF